MNERTKRPLAAAAFLVWIALHLCTGVVSFFEGWYYTYTGWTWMLRGIWLLGLLALDVWIAPKGPGLLRFVKWYWGLSAALAAGALLTVLGCSLSWVLVPGMICSFLTPLWQLLAFSWLLFDEMAGLRGNLRYIAEWSTVLLFCLVHFIYIAQLHRRAKKRGEKPDGPVDFGTGTVESGV